MGFWLFWNSSWRILEKFDVYLDSQFLMFCRSCSPVFWMLSESWTAGKNNFLRPWTKTENFLFAGNGDFDLMVLGFILFVLLTPSVVHLSTLSTFWSIPTEKTRPIIFPKETQELGQKNLEVDPHQHHVWFVLGGWVRHSDILFPCKQQGTHSEHPHQHDVGRAQGTYWCLSCGLKGGPCSEVWRGFWVGVLFLKKW